MSDRKDKKSGSITEISQAYKDNVSTTYILARVMVGVVLGVVTTAGLVALCHYVFFSGAGLSSSSLLPNGSWHRFITVNGAAREQMLTIRESSIIVRMPKQMEVIYDFKNKLSVRHYFQADLDEFGLCFARSFGENQDSSPANYFVNRLKAGYKVNEVRDHMPYVGDFLPAELVTKDMAEMCKGASIFWTGYGRNHDIDKRAVKKKCKEISRQCVSLAGGCKLCEITEDCPNNILFSEKVCE